MKVGATPATGWAAGGCSGSGNSFVTVTVADWSRSSMMTVIGSSCGPWLSHGSLMSSWLANSLLKLFVEGI